MLFHVSAYYLYADNGKRYEQSINTIYECPRKQAEAAGVRWAINRGKANDFGSPACIKIDHYRIGKPEPSGYIKTGVFSIGYVLEWKYDTSPLSVDQLLKSLEK